MNTNVLTLEQQMEIAKMKLSLAEESDPAVLRDRVIEIMGLWLAERNVLLDQIRSWINFASPQVKATPPVPRPNCVVCDVCGVQIEERDGGDVVHFSHGKPGTRSRLHERVCKYARREGCLNTDPTKIGEPQPGDAYDPDIDFNSIHPEAPNFDAT